VAEGMVHETADRRHCGNLVVDAVEHGGDVGVELLVRLWFRDASKVECDL
jgi:hypothetical protein